MGVNVGSAVAYLTLDRSGFRNGLHSAGANLRNFVRGTGEAGGRLRSLGGAMNSMGGALTKAVTLPVAGIGAACAKLASDFETGMAKINTIANVSKGKLAGMRKEILKTSSELGMDANDMAEGVYQSISSGIKTEDAVKFTKIAGKAAIAGFTDTATAVDGLTTVLNAYGKSADDANELANEFLVTQNKGKTTFAQMASVMGNVAPTAAAAGMSTKELNSSVAALTANGINTSEAVTGIKAALSNIIKPSKDAKDAADVLGMQFDANAIKSKGWIGFLGDVKAKLTDSAPAYAKTLDEVNKLKIAINGATKAGEKHKEAIENEKNKIKQLREEKKRLTSKDKERKKQIELEIKTMQEHTKEMREEDRQSKKGAGSTKELKKQLKAKQKQLKLLAETNKGTLTGFSKMFGSVEALNSILTLTSDQGMTLYNDTMKEMETNIHALDDAYGKMAESPERKFIKAKEQMKVLGITIGGHLLPSLVKAMEAFSKFLETIQKLPDPVKKSIVHMLGFAAITGPLLKVAGSGVKLLSVFGKFKNIGSIFTKASTGIIKGGTDVLKALSKLKTGGKIATKGIGLIFGGLGKGVGKVFSGIGSTLTKGVGLFSKLPALLNPHVLLIVAAIAGIGLVVYEVYKHWDGLKKATSKLGKHMSNVWKGITSFFKTSVRGMKIIAESAGNFITEGLLGGIKKKIGKIKSTIGGIGTTIKDKFKSVLGIHSPSRVFSAYGGYIGKGLINGIDGQKGVINSKFKGLGNKIKKLGNVRPKFNKFDDLDLNGVYGGNSGLNNINSNSRQLNFNPTINMHVTVADTGEKGTKQLTQEVKGMGQVAVKNGMVDLFMKDAVRN